MKLELSIAGWRKEVLAQERRQGERARHRQQEAGDEKPPSGQGGHEQAPVEGVRRIEAPLESALEECERIAGRRLRRAMR